MAAALGIIFYIMVFIFLGTLAGSVVILVFCKGLKKNVLYLNVFCGGILAGILGFDLVPYDQVPPLRDYGGNINRYFFNDVNGQNVTSFETFISSSPWISFIAVSSIVHTVTSGLTLCMNFHAEHFHVNALPGAILIHQIPEGR